MAQTATWISDAKNLLEEHGDAFRAYVNFVGMEFAIENFEEAYEGYWDTEMDFAGHLFDELYLHDVPSHLTRYIDYNAFAHDLFINDYMMVPNQYRNGGYVFRNL